MAGLARARRGGQAGARGPAEADGPAGAGLAAAGLGLLAAAGLTLFLVSLGQVRIARMNGLGLISALPVSSLLGLAMLIGAFTTALSLSPRRLAGRSRALLLAAILAAIVVCLDGVTAIVEAEPRFPTTYQIAGFVGYIAQSGHTAPAIDAYFSWPGFFALVAFLQGVAGNHDLTPVLRWWPAAVDLLCLLPLWLILANLRISSRAKWLAALLFTLGNWVGQDYFSPQSFNFLLYLAFAAILLTWFRWPAGPPQPRRPEPRVVRRLATRVFGGLTPGELPPRPISAGDRIALFTLLVAIFAASVVSHQLTPVFMLAACAGLILARRCHSPTLLVLLIVIFAGWVSFGTVAYWSGHLSTVFGGFGQLNSNLSSSVTGRLSGVSRQHELIPLARIAAAVLLAVLAAAGLVRRRRRGTDDRALLVLACVPFAGFAVQSYGGEIALRVYLFALPALCVLTACLFFPERPDVSRAGHQAGPAPAHARPATAAGPGRRRALPAAAAAATILSLALAGLFLLTRYGNEQFEQTPAGELAAMNYLYAHDSRGVLLAWLSEQPAADPTPNMPWSYQDLTKVSYLAVLAPPDPRQVSGLAARLRTLGPGSYLITTSTQEAYLQSAASYPPGWGRQFRASMAAAPGVRVVFSNSAAVIYAYRWPPGTAQPDRTLSATSPVRHTIWTPAGLAVLVLALLSGLALEFTRITRPQHRRALRALTWTAVPLALALLAIVAIRFAVLS
jgi:hypothetical protein